jgi:uncharacterized protein (DUF58 family)
VSTNRQRTAGPIDSQFLAKLDGLRMLSRKIFRGQMRGERRSRNKGQSVEFVDFRPYIKGDDIRRIDWNLYGRLERYYIKLFEEEEDLRLYLLIDCSASMDFGQPGKFAHALKIAAGLAYIVLSNLETVSVSIFAGDYGMVSTPARGNGKIHPLIHQLNRLEPGGASNLGSATAQFAAQMQRSGVVCVISDFMLPDGVQSLAPLLSGGNQLELVHVLAPDELDPPVKGDLELIDRETGERMEVSISGPVLKKYRARLAGLQHELKTFALRGRGDYFLADTSVPPERFILETLRSGRLIR